MGAGAVRADDPEDLTRGRFIAGTGTLALDGTVGPIGGMRDKVVAAGEAGAEVFLVPAENMAELEGVDAGDMRLLRWPRSTTPAARSRGRVTEVGTMRAPRTGR